jgi:predicted lipoprotein with Yx(FWY)xxD motif
MQTDPSKRAYRLGMRRSMSAAALAALVVAAAAAAQPLSQAKVLLRPTSIGRVLVDARGHTLYLYTADRPGRSACVATCSVAWPPYIVPARPSAGAGVKSGLLGTLKREDGRLQATYAGHPLYLSASDTRAGDVKGQGLIGTWFAVAASGKPVRPSQPQVEGKVLLRTTSIGRILVDARGHTLYLYTADTPTKSACVATCSVAWPPYIVPARPFAGAGVTSGLLGTLKRQDGRLQATYAGHPLYFFASDTRAGDVKGQGQIGTWFALAASGEAVKPSATTTTTTPGDGGYGP